MFFKKFYNLFIAALLDFLRVHFFYSLLSVQGLLCETQIFHVFHYVKHKYTKICPLPSLL